MVSLKTFCILLSLFGFLLSCSSTDEKAIFTPIPSPTITIGTKGFESKEGNFSIAIFQPPFQVLSLSSEKANKKGIDVGKQYLWKFERTVYTAMYSGPFDPDGNALPQDFDDMNIGVRKGIARQGAKLISEKEISYGKHPGREFRSIASNGVKYIGRHYLINDIGYQINAGYAEEKDEKEALEVLNSFKLLNEKD